MKDIKYSKKSAQNAWEVDSEIRQQKKEQKQRRELRKNKRKEWE